MLVRTLLKTFAFVGQLAFASDHDLAPGITTIVEGYNVIAKVPCQGCPFIVRHSGEDGTYQWAKDKRENALVFNINLDYMDSSLLVNGEIVWPLPSHLRKIYATQVPHDLTNSALKRMRAGGYLDFNNSTTTGAATFGLSYVTSHRSVENSSAIAIRFFLTGLHSDLPKKPIDYIFNSAQQEFIQVILLERPIYSAFDPLGYDIVRVDLIPNLWEKPMVDDDVLMDFHAWDEFGRKGTFTHGFSSFLNSVLSILAFDTRMMIMIAGGVSIVALALCIYAIYYFVRYGAGDNYEFAQHGKSALQRHRKDDEERGVGLSSREELGMLQKAQMSLLEKHD